MKRGRVPFQYAARRVARPANSGPFSTLIEDGALRPIMTLWRSRATGNPVNEVSTTVVRHSLVNLSAGARQRIRRLFVKASATKSMDWLSSGRRATTNGVRSLCAIRLRSRLRTSRRRLAVESTCALVVDLPAFAAQQDVNALIAIAPLRRRDLMDALPQTLRGCSPGSISKERAREFFQPAGTRQTQLALRHQDPDRLVPCLRAYHFQPSMSFRTALSTVASANSRSSLRYSCSSSFSRSASGTSNLSVLGLPAVDRRLRDPVPPEDFAQTLRGIDFLEVADDLLRAVLPLLQRLPSKLGQTLVQSRTKLGAGQKEPGKTTRSPARD